MQNKTFLSALSFAINNKEHLVLILVETWIPERRKLCCLCLEKSISTHMYHILPAVSDTQRLTEMYTCTSKGLPFLKG